MKRILLLLALFAFVITHAGAYPPGMEVADYRGTGDVLLEAPGYRITEADLFRYAVLTNMVDPESVKEWRELDTAERQRAREALLAYLRGSILAEKWVAEEQGSAAEASLSDTGTRIFSYPAAELLWADQVVRQEIRIFPEDFVYYYKENPEEFGDPGTVRVRRLRVTFPAPMTLDARNRARAEVEELRAQALREGGLEPLLRERPELLVDPPGRTVAIQRGTSGLDPFLISEAFRLGEAQISEPIPTQLGYVLIEVVERQETSIAPIEEVKDEIEAELALQFLPQQFEYLSTKEVIRARPVNRGNLLQFLPDEVAIMRVRRFELSLGDFKRLFPEVIGDPEEPNELAIMTTVAGAVVGETVLQDLERKGLLGDSFYQDALGEARMLYRSGQYVRKLRAELEPTDDEVVEYFIANQETILPGAQKTVWRFQMEARQASQLSAAELESLRLLMNAYTADLTRQAERQMAERARVNPLTAYDDPAQVMRGLPQPGDRRVRTNFTNLGEFDESRTQRELALPHDDLRVGSFTRPVSMRDGSVVSYFVSAETVPPLPDEEEELFELATTSLVLKLSEEEATALIDSWEESGDLRFAPELELDYELEVDEEEEEAPVF